MLNAAVNSGLLVVNGEGEFNISDEEVVQINDQCVMNLQLVLPVSVLDTITLEVHVEITTFSTNTYSHHFYRE